MSISSKRDTGVFVFAPRERGEEGDPPHLGGGGKEGQPGALRGEKPGAPLLPRHAFRMTGPLPLPSFEGRGRKDIGRTSTHCLLAPRPAGVCGTGDRAPGNRSAGAALKWHHGARDIGVTGNAAPQPFDRQVFLPRVEHDVSPGGGFKPQRDTQVCSRFRRANLTRVPMRIFGGAGNRLRTRVAYHNWYWTQSLGPNFEFNLLQLGGTCHRAPHSKKREAPYRPDQPHSEFLIACRPNNNQHTGGINP